MSMAARHMFVKIATCLYEMFHRGMDQVLLAFNANLTMFLQNQHANVLFFESLELTSKYVRVLLHVTLKYLLILSV